MKEDFCFKDKSQIAHEILAYLTDHPDAQDTFEGIMHWWLLDQKIKYQIEIVKETLTELTKNGFLLEHKGGDSQIHYRINKEKYEEIQALLKEMICRQGAP